MISFKSLKVSYDKKTVLHEINGTLPESRFSVVLGPNGSGKTSFLRSLTGLNKQALRTVFIEKNSLESYSLHERSQLVSWAAAGITVPFAFKVYDILLMSRYPIHLGYPSKADHKYVQKVLEDLSLEEFSPRTIGSLSSGEQKQINLARAIAQDTPIIICDEPCAHSDLSVSFKILDYLNFLCLEGKSIIASLHDISKALSYGDYFILLNKGSIEFQGIDFPASEMIEKVFKVRVKNVDDGGKKHMIYEPINW
ncbi:MAG: ABC transporter ATP-binding protein [Oligoflexales bacterium]|nr:ABC transporter ATP-binding protein [Oligoflexales bacterium]